MTKADRQKVFDKFGGRCAYCGCELNDKWQVDHAISKTCWFIFDPIDKNRINDFENLMPACKECNHYKRSHCVKSTGNHIGFRDFMLTFHLRLKKLPQKTRRPKTEQTIIYMHVIADKYNINPDSPFSGRFYFETFKPPTA